MLSFKVVGNRTGSADSGNKCADGEESREFLYHGWYPLGLLDIEHRYHGNHY
jgi:hypothetical protein